MVQYAKLLLLRTTCRTFNSSQEVLKLLTMNLDTQFSTFEHVSGNFCQLSWCDFRNSTANVSFQLFNCMRVVTVDITP